MSFTECTTSDTLAKADYQTISQSKISEIIVNCLKMFFVELEAKMLTLGLDDFGQSMSTAEKHMNPSFLFLGQFLENLKIHKHLRDTKIEEQNK